jgi:MauM/NapG family ferredoxin protein
MHRRKTVTLLFSGLMSFFFNTIPSLGKELSKNNNRLIRPPGAQDEDVFLASCLRCGKCALSCSHKTIKIAHGEKGLSLGTPYIVPRETPCQLCLDCSKVCPSGALKPVEDKSKVRMGTAHFDKDRCLSWLDDECKVCYTNCPFYGKAIKLEGHKRPVVDAEICTGCGICEYVCITDPPSVRIVPK